MRIPRKPWLSTAMASVVVFSAIAPTAAWERDEWSTPWPQSTEGSIGLAADGATHIIFALDCEIYHRTDASGAWAEQKLLAMSDDVVCNHLFDAVFDANGAFYVLYKVERWDTGSHVRVLTNRSGSVERRSAVANAHRQNVFQGSLARRGAVIRVVYTHDGALWLRTIDLDGATSGKRLATSECCYDWPDIAIDGQGKLHVAAAAQPDDVAYLTNASGSWKQRTISAESGVDHFPQIAVQRNGVPHVTWWRCTLCNDSAEDENLIMYATIRSTTWNRAAVARVDRQDGGFVRASVAYSGGVHLAWLALVWEHGAELRYARYADGRWSRKTWEYHVELGEFEETHATPEILGSAARLSRPHLLYSVEYPLRNPAPAFMGVLRN